jgi:MarR family transcriptional regulator, organic hydroperoxide resistance regulator
MYGRALKPFQLTFPQYLVLLALWDADGVLIKNIGERLGMGIGTLNPIMTRLEKQDWIKKTPSLGDKRSVIVSLTEKGKRSKRDIALSILKEISICNFTGIEGETLMKQLKILNRAFAAMEGRPQ